jgi:hypothetical protein
MPSPNRGLCPLTPAPIPPINLASKSLNRNDFKTRQKRRDPYSTPVPFSFCYLLTMTIYYLFTFWQWQFIFCLPFDNEDRRNVRLCFGVTFGDARDGDGSTKRRDIQNKRNVGMTFCRYWKEKRLKVNRRDDFLSILKRKEVYLSLSWSCLDRESRSRHWQKVSLDTWEDLDNLNKNLDAD